MAEAAAPWKVSRWVTSLEPLRGIAALTVCLAHLHLSLEAISGCPYAIPLDAPKQGVCAVTFPIIWWFPVWGVGLFFVLSGFCIHLPQARREAAGGRLELPDNWQFYKQRYRRLGPAYLVSLLLASGVAFAGFETELVHKPGVVDFLSHLLFIHGWTGHLYDLNAPLWSIGVEMQFYWCYPLLLRAYRKWRTGPVTIALFVAGMGMYYLAATRVPEAHRLEVELLFPVIWWKWSLGAWVAEIYTAARSPAWAVALFRFAGSAVFWGIASFAISYTHVKLFGMSLKSLALFGLFFTFVGATVTREWSQGIVFKAMKALGDQSYSLYLVHPIAYALLWPRLAKAGAGPWTTLLVSLGGALVLSRVVYELVEKRTLRPRPAVAG